MNYSLVLKAQFSGTVLTEINKAIELLATTDGVALEAAEIKPIDTPTVIVARRRARRTFSDDPRLVWKSLARPGMHGGSRGIDIAATAINLKLSEEQIKAGNWKQGSVEQRVQKTIENRDIRAKQKVA